MEQKDRLFIMGLSGNGSETEKIWNEFEKLYYNEPFNKLDENYYVIRFFDKVFYKEKLDESRYNIHIGFSSTNEEVKGYSKIVLPANLYVTYNFLVNKGYDNEYKKIKEWYRSYGGYYMPDKIGGKEILVECYDNRFRGVNKEASTGEIWIPVLPILYNN